MSRALVGRESKADLSGTEVVAHVGIGTSDRGGFGLAVQLDVRVPQPDHDAAQALVEKAHETCPYSNATRGNVEVTLTVI